MKQMAWVLLAGGMMAMGNETRILPSSFHCPALGREMAFTVVLPAGYEADADRRWPVLFLLHGRGRNERSLVEDDVCRAALLAAPFVTVLPAGDDGWYLDSPYRPADRYATYLEELIAHCDRTYRLSPRRNLRALSGWSMGGYGCTLYAARHPHDFGVLASMIGLLDFPRTGLPEGQDYTVPRERFGDDPDLWRAWNPLYRAAALQGMKILLQTGATAFDRTMNENFSRQLRQLGIPHALEKREGGHTFAVVQAAVPRVLQFAEQSFKETDMALRATWMREAKYGVFIHFLGGGDGWNREVDAFDAAGFARDCHAAGAAYAVLTLGQNSGYYCSPNATYDQLTGHQAGERCSNRDLPAEVARELAVYGIRLMLYLPSRSPQRDADAMTKLGDVHEQQPAPQEFTRNWSAIIQEWSERYGNQVHGWWFDGSYNRAGWDDLSQPFSWRTWAAACRAGNADSILAFNPGTRLDLAFASLTNEQDYTAGEQNRFEATPESHPCPPTLVWQILCHLGTTWGRTDGPQLDDAAMIDYVRQVNAQGGAVTFEVGHRLGRLHEAHLRQLRAVAAAIR
ncbi:MAG: alpha/beta hydrolase-fold protein [Lentisphaeria bacterium]|nr:alpha/beta hydrolase-fold protein [Lentisphaeria bacterium]